MSITTKAELMPAIAQAWLALNRELNLLSEGTHGAAKMQPAGLSRIIWRT
ncbi:MAG: hypothetical protein R2911_00460 [Caldilineaceae bacterium]